MVLPVADIAPGKNVRADDVGMDRMIASVRKRGVLQPITVVPTEVGDGVECLFGHRRLNAARFLGLETIRCIVRPRESEQSRLLSQLAENQDRKDMTILEEARSYQELREAGMSQQAIADALGTTQPMVSARLLLLKYPASVQQAVHHKQLGLSQALAIPLAAAEDSPVLREAVKAGPHAVREYVAQAQRRAVEKTGKPLPARLSFKPINVRSTIINEVDEAAREMGIPIVEWVQRALQAALDAQAATNLETAAR